MPCPFLQEARVGQCSCSALRKMVVRAVKAVQPEKCSSPEYVSCCAYRAHATGGGAAAESRCPFLDESPVQYCTAAPVLKYIPYTGALLSRCGSDAYRYCELYLALANAGRQPEDKHVGDVLVPARLSYTRNHMWFDPGAGETWHVGIDGFLAKALSRVDRITFLTPSGYRRPSVVLTARGVDLQIVFPCPLPITAIHTYLRAKPAALTEDPYGQGWLFEGSAAEPCGLIGAEEAAESVARDFDALWRSVWECSASKRPGLRREDEEAGDDALARLDREEVLTVFHNLFSPMRDGGIIHES